MEGNILAVLACGDFHKLAEAREAVIVPRRGSHEARLGLIHQPPNPEERTRRYFLKCIWLNFHQFRREGNPGELYVVPSIWNCINIQHQKWNMSIKSTHLLITKLDSRKGWNTKARLRSRVRGENLINLATQLPELHSTPKILLGNTSFLIKRGFHSA